jgi:prenyltransferase/squalene oxidase-like repeat protein
MNDELADQARRSLVKATEFIVSQQGRDGGWHSQTYGQLKDGAGVTALAINAISFLPRDLRQTLGRQIDRGLAFFEQGLAKRKTIASPDGTLDYPTYAAAMWLVSRQRLGKPAPAAQTAVVRDYLLSAQVVEDRGFAPDHPQYGGWDFLGQEDAQGITTGTNISVTAQVLSAIAADQAADKRAATAVQRAKVWVLRCQQPDGGFCFTTEPMSLNNKAGFLDEQRLQPRSYGTATCDGILALLATGMDGASEPVRKAVAWLTERKSLELVPGFEDLPPELGWQRGLRFYYYASLARVLPLIVDPERTARREALAKLLVAAGKTDGSFVNDSDRMRENDPLIATSLAISAFSLCL